MGDDIATPPPREHWLTVDPQWGEKDTNKQSHTCTAEALLAITLQFLGPQKRLSGHRLHFPRYCSPLSTNTNHLLSTLFQAFCRELQTRSHLTSPQPYKVGVITRW